MAEKKAPVQRKAPVDWARARILWEADPALTQAALARMLNVSKVQVTKHVKAQGWKKLKDQQEAAKVVQQRAYSRADERTASAPAQDVPPMPGNPNPGEHPGLPIAAPAETAAIDTAVEMRAQILERHRKEWNGARSNVYEALKTKNFETAKLAKITSEAIKIIQDGERKAWGLDKDDEKPLKLVYDKESEW